MYRYEGPQNYLTIALYGSLYLSFTMDHYVGPNTALTIALHGGLNLAITMDRYEGIPNFPYYILAWRPLLSHYNGPL
jgi:hypothetical protein